MWALGALLRIHSTELITSHGFHVVGNSGSTRMRCGPSDSAIQWMIWRFSPLRQMRSKIPNLVHQNRLGHPWLPGSYATHQHMPSRWSWSPLRPTGRIRITQRLSLVLTGETNMRDVGCIVRNSICIKYALQHDPHATMPEPRSSTTRNVVVSSPRERYQRPNVPAPSERMVKKTWRRSPKRYYQRLFVPEWRWSTMTGHERSGFESFGFHGLADHMPGQDSAPSVSVADDSDMTFQIVMRPGLSCQRTENTDGICCLSVRVPEIFSDQTCSSSTRNWLASEFWLFENCFCWIPDDIPSLWAENDRKQHEQTKHGYSSTPLHATSSSYRKANNLTILIHCCGEESYYVGMLHCKWFKFRWDDNSPWASCRQRNAAVLWMPKMFVTVDAITFCNSRFAIWPRYLMLDEPEYYENDMLN